MDGKIIDGSLTREDIKAGKGAFENQSIVDVAILDCKQLQSFQWKEIRKHFCRQHRYEEF